MITLTRIQARFREVEAIMGRAPALRLNEIVLLRDRDGTRGLMTADEGGLRSVRSQELREYVAACRDALERGEALLSELSRREPEAPRTFVSAAAEKPQAAERFGPAHDGNWGRVNSHALRALRQQRATRGRWLS